MGCKRVKEQAENDPTCTAIKRHRGLSRPDSECNYHLRFRPLPQSDMLNMIPFIGSLIPIVRAIGVNTDVEMNIHWTALEHNNINSVDSTNVPFPPDHGLFLQHHLPSLPFILLWPKHQWMHTSSGRRRRQVTSHEHHSKEEAARPSRGYNLRPCSI